MIAHGHGCSDGSRHSLFGENAFLTGMRQLSAVFTAESHETPNPKSTRIN
jgi:hypothetical protein